MSKIAKCDVCEEFEYLVIVNLSSIGFSEIDICDSCLIDIITNITEDLKTSKNVINDLFSGIINTIIKHPDLQKDFIKHLCNMVNTESKKIIAPESNKTIKNTKK